MWFVRELKAFAKFCLPAISIDVAILLGSFTIILFFLFLGKSLSGGIQVCMLKNSNLEFKLVC